MIQVLKFSSSGLYSGEVAAQFETIDEAEEFLDRKAARWEDNGDDHVADLEETNSGMFRLELTADSVADSIVYRTKEVKEQIFEEEEF
jgi:hypothetical protein